jgi:DNA (cytosine-5)-methyltransferase 1
VWSGIKYVFLIKGYPLADKCNEVPMPIEGEARRGNIMPFSILNRLNMAQKQLRLPFSMITRQSLDNKIGASILTSLELCAGGGGQALGLEKACFDHQGLVEIDRQCCETLRFNRPNWRVFEKDIETFDGTPFKGIDLLAGGLPCPPFSVAGKQLGKADERNLFPAAIRLIDEIRPRAVMIENVRGLLDAIFNDYRNHISGQIDRLGYTTGWRLLNAADYGVPQLRPRVIFVAIRKDHAHNFDWPNPYMKNPLTVGETLYDLIASNGWQGAEVWRRRANSIAPTIVGGSKKHGGPDLGPTRARKAWAALGVDGLGIADAPPHRDFVGMPRLSVTMVARLQGFPDNWIFTGKKTPAYRQVGNAFPPPVACAVAESIALALINRCTYKASG